MPVPTFNRFTSGISAGAAPNTITAGPNNTIWFADRQTVSNGVFNDAIGYLSDQPGAQIQEVKISNPRSNGDPFGMAYDPTDGNAIWFTERNGHTLDEIDPTNPASVKRFGLGVTLQSASYPRDIAVSPKDGDLWVGVGSDTGTQRLMNVYNHKTGALLFSYTLKGYDPMGLAFDDAGNLWIAERDAHQLEELDASGNSVAIVPLCCGAYPYSVALGPDHNIWVADIGNAIDKVDPSGKNPPVRYAVPGCQPQTIVSDNTRGVLWFTNYACSHLAQITTSGLITKFSAPGTFANGLTMGPNGDLFYTDMRSAAIFQAIP